MRKVLARHQSHFRRSAFEYAGVDQQSQKAYELASEGAPRPQMDSPAVLYSVELLRFAAPYFTLEVQTVGENDTFLRAYVQELGLNLRTTACCNKLRRVRQGRFTPQHALLPKHWTLQNLLDNMALSARVLNNIDKVDDAKSSTTIRTSDAASSSTVMHDGELVERIESDWIADDLDASSSDADSDGSSETSARRSSRSSTSDSQSVDCLNIPWGREY